ncbi:hypothetical protein CARUB_v10002575mg, partial [Capsella rubella]
HHNSPRNSLHTRRISTRAGFISLLVLHRSTSRRPESRQDNLESFDVMKKSDDLKKDFRESMIEMIEETTSELQNMVCITLSFSFGFFSFSNMFVCETFGYMK